MPIKIIGVVQTHTVLHRMDAHFLLWSLEKYRQMYQQKEKCPGFCWSIRVIARTQALRQDAKKANLKIIFRGVSR